ncbi:MAG: Fe-S-containing protein [Candidatus Hodarchaeales archaeon]|jgi:uncharacterized membrane protein
MKPKIDQENEHEQDEQLAGLSSKHLGIAVVFIAIVTFALIITLQPGSDQNIIAAKQDGDNLVIEVTNVKPEAKFYYFEVSDVQIQFFAVLGFDNQPHIAFDACDVCYESKKGYSHEDPYMRCRNCDNTFLVDSIGTENIAGGCWPSYLPVSIEAGEILIDISDVTQKMYMFA